MIEYVIRPDNRGKETLRIYQDYDLAQIILSVDDKPIAKVPIAELEMVLKTIKGGNRMNILIDYAICKECQNQEAYYTCYKCGKCGRVFENGVLIDENGTTVEGEEDEQGNN